jgi:hypothetical protein
MGWYGSNAGLQMGDRVAQDLTVDCRLPRSSYLALIEAPLVTRCLACVLD